MPKFWRNSSVEQVVAQVAAHNDSGDDGWFWVESGGLNLTYNWVTKVRLTSCEGTDPLSWLACSSLPTCLFVLCCFLGGLNCRGTLTAKLVLWVDLIVWESFPWVGCCADLCSKSSHWDCFEQQKTKNKWGRRTGKWPQRAGRAVWGLVQWADWWTGLCFLRHRTCLLFGLSNKKIRGSLTKNSLPRGSPILWEWFHWAGCCTNSCSQQWRLILGSPRKWD